MRNLPFIRTAAVVVLCIAIWTGGLQPILPLYEHAFAQSCVPPSCTDCTDGATQSTCQNRANASKDGSIVKPKGDGSLQLLQPIDDGSTKLDAQSGLGLFFEYFNRAWPWVLGIASGMGVLWGLVGGIEIMVGRMESGKERIMWAAIGLLIIGLAGLILRTLNPLFYN